MEIPACSGDRRTVLRGPRSSYVTGTVLPVDGGWLVR